jgi:hypothetical protein
VALLGNRPSVPLFYRWTPEEMRVAIIKDKVDYVLVSFLSKNDIQGGRARDLADLKLEVYTEPAFALSDGIFLLRKVKR